MIFDLNAPNIIFATFTDSTPSRNKDSFEKVFFFLLTIIYVSTTKQGSEKCS